MIAAPRPFRIYSVPGSGTRFVQAFFAYQGVAVDYSHAGSKVADILLVIPVRHPLDCYLTNLYRGNLDLPQFVGWWHELIERATDAFLFPIGKKNEATEKAACEYVGLDWRPGFVWVPVGGSCHDRQRIAVPALVFAVDWFNGRS